MSLYYLPEVDELSVPRGQPVVDHDLHPLPESPEPEPEDTAVIAVETLKLSRLAEGMGGFAKRPKKCFQIENSEK